MTSMADSLPLNSCLFQIDYDEFEEIERLCNSHPAVLKEVEKLKLPAG